MQNGKVAVLDFSAARNGPLVAYRWDGKAELGNHKLVAVGGTIGNAAREGLEGGV